MLLDDDAFKHSIDDEAAVCKFNSHFRGSIEFSHFRGSIEFGVVGMLGQAYTTRH